jgi:hypothetical protein
MWCSTTRPGEAHAGASGLRTSYALVGVQGAVNPFDPLSPSASAQALYGTARIDPKPGAEFRSE